MDSLNKPEPKAASLSELEPIIRERLAEGKTVRFSPMGTSMLPMLRQGKDSVVLSSFEEAGIKKYDVLFYKRKGGQFVLHRAVKLCPDGSFLCICDNQINTEKVERGQLIGVLKAFYRGERYVSVRSLTYRAYVCFWHGVIRPLRKLRSNIRKFFKKSK